VRLSRNRDFVLFQAGQLLSASGSGLLTIAYPLLVLTLTGSPAKAGVVSFARLLAAPLLALPAGVAADRLDRRRIMLASDAVRAVAIASLALPDAVSVQQGRVALVGIVGPPAGGALFAVTRALPFAVDAISYVFSFVAVSAIRTPFQQARERRPLHIRADLAEGFRFLWTQPFLRATSFFYAVGNFTIPAFLFILLVVARQHGLTGGEIGILLALFSACILVGSLLGGAARRRLSLRAIVMLEAYSGLLVALFLIDPNVWVLVCAVLPQAFVLPVTDSYVIAHRLAATPDRLLGRAEAARATVAVFLALQVGEALYATAATALRSPPPLEEPTDV
jgi:hypothetical protein